MRLFTTGPFELKSLPDKHLRPFGSANVEFLAKKSIDNSQPLVVKQLTTTNIAQIDAAKGGQYGAAIVASRLQETTCEQRSNNRLLIASGMGRSKIEIGYLHRNESQW